MGVGVKSYPVYVGGGSPVDVLYLDHVASFGGTVRKLPDNKHYLTSYSTVDVCLTESANYHG